MKRFLNISTQLLFVLGLMLIVTPCYARNVELVWDSNNEPDLAGYRIYYKIGSPRVCQASVYDGSGLTYVGDPYDGVDVDSGFEVRKEDLDPDSQIVRCRLDGLSDNESYYFAVTAYDTEGLESGYSMEVSFLAPIISTLKINDAESDYDHIYTNNRQISVEIAASDDHPIEQYLIFDDECDYTTGVFQPIPGGAQQNVDFTIADFTLNDSDGNHTIYVWVKDNLGVLSSYATKTNIILDRIAPVSAIIYTDFDGRTIYGISSDDNGSGLQSTQIMITDGTYYLQADDTWTTVETWFTPNGGTQSEWFHDASHTAFTQNTTYTVRTRASDLAGNTETPGPGNQYTYQNPSVVNQPFIDFSNNTIDITYSQDEMLGATVEGNYFFSPQLEFATLGELNDITNISGSTYRLALAPIPPYTIYTLTLSNITNTAGYEVWPNVVRINDNDHDDMADDWETFYGLDPTDPFDAYLDSDNDGHANLTEYTTGTDPQDAGSYPIVTLGVDHITVTDVTPDSFSVVWQATEASTCSLAVYDDTNTLLGNLDITSESALHPPAEDNGVMKVTVSGLQPNTTYRFQTVTTSISGGIARVAPAYLDLLEVVTESATVAVANDPLEQEVYDEDEIAADGTLLMASVEGGAHPVTAWVGENVYGPYAQVDLNQIYSELTHENLQLLGDEELTLWSFGGMLGNYVNVQKIAAPTGQVQMALPEVSYLSLATGYYLDLNEDLNIFALPVYSKAAFTAHSLLYYLEEQIDGDLGSTSVKSIKRYDEQTGSWEAVSWFFGNPTGPDFPIKPGEAYLIYMKEDVDVVWFEGFDLGSAVDLAVGLNLTCLPAPRDGFTYTSYEMLQDLGDENEVSSIKRYSLIDGWQNTFWFFYDPSGVEYDTRKGEGYLIYMKQEKLGWRPY